MKSNWFQSVIQSIAEKGRELLGLEQTNGANADLSSMCKRLLASHGEASNVALSQQIIHLYHGLDSEKRLDFFKLLADEFNPDILELKRAAQRYFESGNPQDLITLNNVLEAPRQELFRRLNLAPSGTAHLVSLRADLLKLLKRHQELICVDADLKHILSSWFNRGFLQLRNIDWTSPAFVLEKLINYESVHEIRGWDDLRRRLMQDRRCFAFFHPAMPDEPLIFIEIALVNGLTDNISDLINPTAPMLEPRQADTAIFYSINNTQTGLRGISFGNFLIKQVLVELSYELPWIKTSSTLSPIPSFAGNLKRWLSGEARQPVDKLFENVILQNNDSILQVAENNQLDTSLPIKGILNTILENNLSADDKTLHVLLSDLALAHLTTIGDNNKLPDPVAIFHLSNGARLERINTYADTSEHGLTSSFGVMVNYLYNMSDVERNHEAFVSEKKIVMSEHLNKRARQLEG
ncbi:MAG: decarboxylase [Gammaproteobacteria bacterium]|nr:decarboxylase [Gammaproteobacteria bacterium]